MGESQVLMSACARESCAVSSACVLISVEAQGISSVAEIPTGLSATFLRIFYGPRRANTLDIVYVHCSRLAKRLIFGELVGGEDRAGEARSTTG